MLFIDACYFIALGNQNDQWHKQSLEIIPKIRNKHRITSILTVTEAINIIGSKNGGKSAQNVFTYIEDAYEIVYVNAEMTKNAMEKHLHYNGTLSLADAMSVEIMENYGIKTIVSFDSDFDKVKGIKRIQ